MQEIIVIIVSAVLVNNFIFSRFLGCCPFVGVSNKSSSSIGMGFAVIFVLTLASLVIYLINAYVLVPLHLQFLQTLTYILVIAALVQLVEMFINKYSPALYQALGIYLPLITTNCAVLGVALLNTTLNYNLIESTVHGFAAGVGFLFALVLISSVRESLERARIPEAFKGAPIAFISAGLVALIFLAFKGIIPE
jgi:electron transport complex protein RnfA